MFEEQEVIPLQTNAAGQLIVYVLPTAKSDQGSFDEVMLSEMNKSATDPHQIVPFDVTLEPQSQAQTSSAMSEPSCTHLESKASLSSDPNCSAGLMKIPFLEQYPHLASKVHTGIWLDVELCQTWKPMKSCLMR